MKVPLSLLMTNLAKLHKWQDYYTIWRERRFLSSIDYFKEKQEFIDLARRVFEIYAY